MLVSSTRDLLLKNAKALKIQQSNWQIGSPRQPPTISLVYPRDSSLLAGGWTQPGKALDKNLVEKARSQANKSLTQESMAIWAWVKVKPSGDRLF